MATIEKTRAPKEASIDSILGGGGGAVSVGHGPGCACPSCTGSGKEGSIDKILGGGGDAISVGHGPGCACPSCTGSGKEGSIDKILGGGGDAISVGHGPGCACPSCTGSGKEGSIDKILGGGDASSVTSTTAADASASVGNAASAVGGGGDATASNGNGSSANLTSSETGNSQQPNVNVIREYVDHYFESEEFFDSPKKERQVVVITQDATTVREIEIRTTTTSRRKAGPDAGNAGANVFVQNAPVMLGIAHQHRTKASHEPVIEYMAGNGQAFIVQTGMSNPSNAGTRNRRHNALPLLTSGVMGSDPLNTVLNSVEMAGSEKSYRLSLLGNAASAYMSFIARSSGLQDAYMGNSQQQVKAKEPESRRAGPMTMTVAAKGATSIFNMTLKSEIKFGTGQPPNAKKADEKTQARKNTSPKMGGTINTAISTHTENRARSERKEAQAKDAPAKNSKHKDAKIEVNYADIAANAAPKKKMEQSSNTRYNDATIEVNYKNMDAGATAKTNVSPKGFGIITAIMNGTVEGSAKSEYRAPETKDAVKKNSGHKDAKIEINYADIAANAAPKKKMEQSSNTRYNDATIEVNYKNMDAGATAKTNVSPKGFGIITAIMNGTVEGSAKSEYRAPETKDAVKKNSGHKDAKIEVNYADIAANAAPKKKEQSGDTVTRQVRVETSYVDASATAISKKKVEQSNNTRPNETVFLVNKNATAVKEQVKSPVVEEIGREASPVNETTTNQVTKTVAEPTKTAMVRSMLNGLLGSEIGITEDKKVDSPGIDGKLPSSISKKQASSGDETSRPRARTVDPVPITIANESKQHVRQTKREFEELHRSS